MKISKLIAIGIIKTYQAIISPVIPMSCRFMPTCSQYGIEVIGRFGVIKGCCFLVKRLLKCHPLGGHGFDPPPDIN